MIVSASSGSLNRHGISAFILLAISPLFVHAQQLIPNTLPACAQQCTVLQQAQTGCVPAGGAPVTNPGTYQSCFCQSALLTQLYGATGAQLCSQCSAGDMGTIQDWYKGYCGKGGSNGAAAAATGAAAGSPTTAGGAAAPAATTATNTNVNWATASPSLASNMGNQGINLNAKQGPWINHHWKWIIMLLVIILGLVAIAVGGSMLHRRYHARRQAQWSSAPGSHPDINTWGPGQSVHDLRYGVSRSPDMSTTVGISPGVSTMGLVQPMSGSMSEKGRPFGAHSPSDDHPPPPLPASSSFGSMDAHMHADHAPEMAYRGYMTDPEKGNAVGHRGHMF